jgi:hypothetical protein
VVALNLGYFGIEFAVATHIGSVSLFADSIDFIEDATVNAFILLGLGWSARTRPIGPGWTTADSGPIEAKGRFEGYCLSATWDALALAFAAL